MAGVRNTWVSQGGVVRGGEGNEVIVLSSLYRDVGTGTIEQRMRR